MGIRQKIVETDIEIFPIVLGTVGAGEVFDQAITNNLIDKYLDLGGNTIDTARMYTNGKSEEALGRWIKKSGRRNEIVLITKGGHPRVETMHTSRMKEADMRSDIEESLKTLNTDYIDIYFYHRDDLGQPVEESVEIMEKFVREGKIRYYGCSNWKAYRIREAIEYSRRQNIRGFVANQMLFNIASEYMKPFQDDTMEMMDEEMKKVHCEYPILSIPYFGVCSGFFYVLKARGEEAVKNSPYYTKENLAIAKRVFELADTYHTTITAVLLHFFLVQEFPCCPLYGPTSTKQLNDLEGILDIGLKKEDYQF